jgi:hypothetical protein
MKTTASIFCCLICLICTQIAFGGYYDSLYPWGYWYPYAANSYESIPYYALHPPVYYSHPIARSYGDSPYPYPPGLMAILAAESASGPQIMRNDYEGNQSDSSEMTTQSGSEYQIHRPLRIKNPFVEQSDDTDVNKGVKWEVLKPQKPLVVYPMSLTR